MKNLVVVPCVVMLTVMGCRSDESQGTNPPGVGTMSGLDAGFSFNQGTDASSSNGRTDAGAANRVQIPVAVQTLQMLEHQIRRTTRVDLLPFLRLRSLSMRLCMTLVPSRMTSVNGLSSPISVWSVDIQGWVLKDNFSNRHVIGSSVVIQPGAYVVLGRAGANNGGYSWIMCMETISGSKTGEDAVILENSNGMLMDSVEYRTDVPWPAKRSGYSIELTTHR